MLTNVTEFMVGQTGPVLIGTIELSVRRRVLKLRSF